MAHAASRPHPRRAHRRFAAVLLAGLVGLLTLSVSAPAAANEVGLDEYDFKISGLVELADEPLADVLLVIEGGGFRVEVESGEDGRWAVGVPEKGDYTVTLDENTLPEGIAVIDPEDETPNVREITVGQSGSAVANFFIGQGERNTTSLFDQIVERMAPTALESSAAEVFELFRTFNREFGCAVLLVTHDPRLSEQCDRTITLVDGRIESDKRADDAPGGQA